MTKAYIFWLLVVVVFAAGAVTYYQTSTQTDARIAILIGSQNSELGIITEKISGFLRGPAMLLDSLRTEKPILAALDKPQNNISQLEQALKAIASRDVSFQQVRWIDEKGMERIRIQRIGKSLITIPPQHLQDTTDSYYVQATRNLSPGDIYFSELDLNIEQGKIEKPLNPTIRVAVPVSDTSGQPRGIFIINRFASEIIDLTDNSSNEFKRLLTNSKGDWLRGFDRNEEWSFMFGRTDRVETRSPMAWDAISNSDHGNIMIDDGLWIWSTIDVAEMRWVGVPGKPINGPELKLISHMSQAMIQSMKQDVLSDVTTAIIPLSGAFWLVLIGLFQTREKHRNTVARLAESEHLRKAEATVSAAREQSESLIKNNVNGMLLVDESGTIVMTNPALDNIFGYAEGELTGEPLEILVPKNFASKHRRLRTGYIAMPSNQIMMAGRPVMGRDKNGNMIPIEVSLSPTPSPDGMRVSGTVTDISERLKYESELRTLASVSNNSCEAVVITDGNMNILNVNKAFTDITGYSQAEILGRTPTVFEATRHSSHHFKHIFSELASCGNWKGEHWGLRKDGKLYPEWMSASTVKDTDGNISHYILEFSDISSLRTTQQELKYLAYNDSLTGLPNRVLVIDRVNHALTHAVRHKRQLALIFIDLDNFKHINDALGHQAGDRLLKQVARILTSNVRKDDTVARIGGDEFLVLLEDLKGPEDSAAVASTLLGSLDIPFDLDNELVRMTASMGISHFPEDGTDYDSLLQCADAAMYTAKESGRNRYCYYTKGLKAQSTERIRLEMSLKQALNDNQIYLVYQPQIDLASGQLIGVEALARWLHPTLGQIPPGKFVHLAEESGLIHALDHWVVRTACEQAQDWLNREFSFGRMAINLSGLQLQNERFSEELTTILANTGCPPHMVEFEITERFIMQQGSSVIQELTELREIGISLAIDDFGTGYSSLAYLKRLPIDKLKIDQSFIHDLSIDKSDQQIVSAVIAMGKSLGLTVIAEGVEKEEEAKLLRDMKCDQAQGYFFAKPLTTSQLEQSLIATGSGHYQSDGVIIPLFRNKDRPRMNGES